jgi:hypothetical protein
MRTQFAVTAAFSMALLLIGCARGSVYGVSNGISFAYPTMGFAGPYSKQLTLDDVRQIVRLANDRPDVLKPVDQIVVDHPGEAEVHTGNPQSTGDRACRFHAHKQNGRWFISDKPYCTNETIITS